RNIFVVEHRTVKPEDSELHFWNVETGVEVGRLKRARCLGIAADGKTLFAAQKAGDDSNYSRVILWDVEAARPRGQVGTFSAGRMGMALASDQRVAALWTEWPDARDSAVDCAQAEGVGHLEFWDLRAVRCVARARTPATAQHGRFSLDGKQFVLPCPRG